MPTIIAYTHLWGTMNYDQYNHEEHKKQRMSIYRGGGSQLMLREFGAVSEMQITLEEYYGLSTGELFCRARILGGRGELFQDIDFVA